MLLPEPDLYCAGLLVLQKDFRNIFLPNISEDQKKFHQLSAGPLASTAPYYGKSGPGYCITFIKR